MAARIFVGVDTGATRTRIAGGGEYLSFLTPQSYDEYVSRLWERLERLPPIKRIVIALPTVIVDQTITEPPNLGEGWDRANLQGDLRKRAKGRIREVVLAQDTEAAGYGVLDRSSTLPLPALLITLSTGLGGALLTKGGVLPLEAGHMMIKFGRRRAKCACKQYGCAEAYLSGTGLKRRRIDPQNASPAFWRLYGEELGRYFGALAPPFMAKRILLMGGVSKQSRHFLPTCKAWLEANIQRMPPPPIRLISKADRIGAYGALVMAHAGRGGSRRNLNLALSARPSPVTFTR